MYPKARIFISLILPTKDAGLNFRINELNKHLRNIAANIENVQIIEHYNLVNENGFLNPLFGRYRNGLTNPDDPIHLGTSVG